MAKLVDHAPTNASSAAKRATGLESAPAVVVITIVAVPSVGGMTDVGAAAVPSHVDFPPDTHHGHHRALEVAVLLHHPDTIAVQAQGGSEVAAAAAQAQGDSEEEAIAAQVQGGSEAEATVAQAQGDSEAEAIAAQAQEDSEAEATAALVDLTHPRPRHLVTPPFILAGLPTSLFQFQADCRLWQPHQPPMSPVFGR